MSQNSGVGMPAALWLDQFGAYVWDAFGETPYLVGSVLAAMQGRATKWRDVDVRILLPDARYAADGYGKPGSEEHHNAKWVATCLAWSEFGKHLTGLPIDFQIQQQSYANEHYDERRSALGLVPHRFAPSSRDKSGRRAQRPRGKK